MNSGPLILFNPVNGAQRHHLAVVVGDVKLAHVFGAGAVFALGLDINLPLPAEAVEVVDQVAAHERLQRLIHVADVDALPLHLGAVDVDELLRNAGRKVEVTADQFGTLAGRRNELLNVVR